MGRDWLNWVSGGGANGATMAAAPKRRRKPAARCKPEEEYTTASGGCMSAVFHLFDLHPNIQFPLNQLPNSGDTPTNDFKKSPTNLNLPMGISRIKTRVPGSKPEDSSSVSGSYSTEYNSSPGTKTPNLVARLMGLDSTPSPSFSSSNSGPHLKSSFRQYLERKDRSRKCFLDDTNIGARSLPETTRISSARRSDSEFHRIKGKLSRQQDENRSPGGHYGKQILKQVKEIVGRSRSAGQDITNIFKEEVMMRRDENLIMIKNSRRKSTDKGCRRKNEDEDEVKKKPLETKKERLRDKKWKIAPLQMNVISGPTVLPVKKDPSPPATKLPLKQVSDALSSKRNTHISTNSYNKLNKIFTIPHTVLPDNPDRCAAAAAAEYKTYIQRILNRAGIKDHFTPLKLGKWHTPAHPLDPSIFYHLELFHPGGGAALNSQCNRRLIFELVDELLLDILKPYFDFRSNNLDQFCLIDELCKRIGGFPAADCRVLEDIDSLIGGDLGKWEFGVERIVREIEGEMVEGLVREMIV